MSTLNASVNPVVVDNLATPPKISGATQIVYHKESTEELWEIMPGGVWTEVNVHVRTGGGDEADYRGDFPITLQPGQSYRAGLFEQEHGPLSTDPNPRADLVVLAVLKRPEASDLIMIVDHTPGGTWDHVVVRTRVPTSVALVGASRTRPVVDSDGIPSLVEPDGGLARPTAVAPSHTMALLPLVPGHHYFFAVMVVDAAGNWDARLSEFTTLRRKLTVTIPRIHIYNDGDPGSVGEADFGFRVSASDGAFARHSLQDFSLPEFDIDDWSETDRPYAVGFAYAELLPQTIPPDRRHIRVSSWATEHDGALEADEGAGNLLGVELSLPAGPTEKVTNSTFTMDCPTTTDDDFHYGVDVTYSVEYLP